MSADLRRLIARRVAAHKHYPLLARRRGQQGLVVVEFRIAADGVARDVTVIRSAGPALDAAAQEAVRRARPLPPVTGRVQVPVRFSLRD